MNAKQTATGGVLLALALILSYIDSMIPMPIPVAGIKLGLANLVVLFALYRMNVGYAAVISVARVILSGLMFSGFSGIMYSLAGAVLSLFVMYMMHRYTDHHIIPVSVCGSIAHIIGQLLIAGLMTDMSIVIYYGPLLLVSALIAGIIIGALAVTVLNNVKLPEQK